MGKKSKSKPTEYRSRRCRTCGVVTVAPYDEATANELSICLDCLATGTFQFDWGGEVLQDTDPTPEKPVQPAEEDAIVNTDADTG